MLVILALAVLSGLAIWWLVPAIAPPTFVPPPDLSEARQIELKAQHVHVARIRGMDATSSSQGISARLTGGYVDPERIVLFLRLDPPGRPAPHAITLKDQFGRSYRSTASFADVQTGENILYFEGPGALAAATGLRLSLELPWIHRGHAIEPEPMQLALQAVLVGEDASLASYATNMAITYAVLAAAGLAYIGVMLGLVRLVRGRWNGPVARGLIGGVAFAVLALPTNIAVATLFRHDPVGIGGLQRQSDEHVRAAMVAFFAIEAAAIIVGANMAANSLRSTARGGSASRGWTAAAAGVAVFGFLVLSLPLVEFANACYVGTGFLLKPSC